MGSVIYGTIRGGPFRNSPNDPLFVFWKRSRFVFVQFTNQRNEVLVVVQLRIMRQSTISGPSQPASFVPTPTVFEEVPSGDHGDTIVSRERRTVDRQFLDIRQVENQQVFLILPIGGWAQVLVGSTTGNHLARKNQGGEKRSPATGIKFFCIINYPTIDNIRFCIILVSLIKSDSEYSAIG